MVPGSMLRGCYRVILGNSKLDGFGENSSYWGRFNPEPALKSNLPLPSW
jgi:hypothetical protein